MIYHVRSLRLHSLVERDRTVAAFGNEDAESEVLPALDANRAFRVKPTFQLSYEPRRASLAKKYQAQRIMFCVGYEMDSGNASRVAENFSPTKRTLLIFGLK